MPAYDFTGAQQAPIPAARTPQVATVLDLRGLDRTTPVDLMKEGRTPRAKNFRLYAQQTDDRQVAVSSRKGPGFYINPLNETLSVANESTTGASTSPVGIVNNVIMQKFTASNSNYLTKLQLKVANPGGASGPLLVQVYSDVDSLPAKLLTESSISNGDISDTSSWLTARFLKALKLTNGTSYWIVVSIQDDGADGYTLSTTTAGTKALVTNGPLAGGVLQYWGINFRTYTTAPGVSAGEYRFERDNGNNITIVAIGTTMYKIDEVSDTLVPIITGLSSSATEYKFTNGDNKVFWVNGYDQLTAWNGSLEADYSTIVANGTFEVNATGWTAGASDTATRVTSDFHSGVASLNITASSTNRTVSTAVTMSKGKRYRITYWVKGASGTVALAPSIGGTPISASTVTLTGSWQQVDFYYAPTYDITNIDFQGPAVNWFLDDVVIKETGIEYIVDSELPILSDVTMHKDRLWGKVASDPNKLVFSENPGNPAFQPDGVTPLPANQQWYYAWLSVSFIYVPRPHNGSPITGMISFQDALTVFTQDKKYIINGYDRGSFVLRESTGVKGALSSRGIANDENRIYFVSDDGLYEYNGSSDKKLSDLVNPLFDGCIIKERITPVIWKNKVRFYMGSPGSTINDTCLLYNKDLEEWEYDTQTYIDSALYYNDADDDNELIEFSSLAPFAVQAEVDYNSLGAPIDFEYDLPYSSLNTPAQRKRIRKFFPLFQGVDTSFPISVAMDKDFQDSPRIKEVGLIVNGNILGEGADFGDGTLFGGATSFKINKLRFSGYGYYWQLRIYRKAVNNRVAFIGAQFTYKTKRL